MTKPLMPIRRRAELALAKLKDILHRTPPRTDLETLRRNEEFMLEVELHCKGSLRNGMLLMAEKFEQMEDVRLPATDVARMLRKAETELRGDDGYLGRCPGCDRPFEEHGRFYIADRFEAVICLGVPANMMIMIGPETASAFQKAAGPFIPVGPVGVNSLPPEEQM